MKSLNYEDDVRIDESALDVELLRQPSLILNYSTNAAHYERHLTKLKERLEVCKAELDKKIRTDPEGYEISKVTETAISNTIITQPEYQELKADIIDCEYELRMARAALSSLSDKKMALENLVKLHGMNYFAGPSLPRDLTQEWRKSAEQKGSNAKVVIGGKTRSRTT